MSNACIALESPNGTLNAVYCYRDGMPKYLGVILKSVFCDIDNTRKLVSLGNLSAIVPYNETVFSEKKYMKFGSFMAERLNETVYSFKSINEFLKPDTWIQKFNIEFLYLQKADGSWHFYRHDYTGELYEINYDKNIFLQMTNDFFAKINCMITSDSEYDNLSKPEIFGKLRAYVHKMLVSLDIRTITYIHNRALFEKSALEGNYNKYVRNFIVFDEVFMQDILDMTDFDMLARFIIDNIFVKGNTWLYEIEEANNFMMQHSSIFRSAMNKLADVPKAGYNSAKN